MNTMLRVLPLLCLMALTGCLTNIQSTEIKADDKSLNSKAIVLTKAYAPTNSIFAFTDAFHVVNYWERVDQDTKPEDRIHYDLSESFWTRGFGSPTVSAHMVEPGTYVLKDMRFQTGNVNYSIKMDPMNPTTFKVAAGEVVYIGDLKVNAGWTDATLELEDNYDDAVKAFKTEMPNLNKPVEKRLLQSVDLGHAIKMLKQLKEELDKTSVKKK
jgi:hypothetical protein